MIFNSIFPFFLISVTLLINNEPTFAFYDLGHARKYLTEEISNLLSSLIPKGNILENLDIKTNEIIPEFPQNSYDDEIVADNHETISHKPYEEKDNDLRFPVELTDVERKIISDLNSQQQSNETFRVKKKSHNIIDYESLVINAKKNFLSKFRTLFLDQMNMTLSPQQGVDANLIRNLYPIKTFLKTRPSDGNRLTDVSNDFLKPDVNYPSQISIFSCRDEVERKIFKFNLPSYIRDGKVELHAARLWIWVKSNEEKYMMKPVTMQINLKVGDLKWISFATPQYEAKESWTELPLIYNHQILREKGQKLIPMMSIREKNPFAHNPSIQIEIICLLNKDEDCIRLPKLATNAQLESDGESAQPILNILQELSHTQIENMESGLEYMKMQINRKHLTKDYEKYRKMSKWENKRKKRYVESRSRCNNYRLSKQCENDDKCVWLFNEGCVERCSAKSHCCKIPIRINLDLLDISGIIDPAIIHTAYCIGLCGLHISNSLATLVDAKISGRKLCCAPTETDPIYVYRSIKGTVLSNQIKDAIVLDCKCI
ncbi:hypothetical protein SNEBB_009624 [Seison nebaliae]|nr:hypothetical protein SNEBB_009624 [Seison nebaliae]